MNTEECGDDVSRWIVGESQWVSTEAAEVSTSNETLGKCETNIMHIHTEESVA